jgi:hypothetical protein
MRPNTHRPLSTNTNTSQKPSQKIKNTMSKKNKKRTSNKFETMINEIINPNRSYENNNSSKQQRTDKKNTNSSKKWGNNSSNRQNNRSSSRSNSKPNRRN